MVSRQRLRISSKRALGFDGHDSVHYNGGAMQPLKARVKNGRLVLDEPTDRAEGEVVELVLLDEVLADSDEELTDEERAEIRAELEASLAEANVGNLIDADVALVASASVLDLRLTNR
jgi:hypothetical protein